MVLPGKQTGHAYLFEGDAEGAITYAKALNCLAGGEMPCQSCISCRVFASGNHPDTHYVVNTNTKSKTNDIGVEDVRKQIVAEMATAPSHYKYKVFIINKAETLTPTAQNALLKTIEEPAPFGVFLLITSNMEAILETVRSRCVTVRNTALAETPTETDVQALANELTKDNLDILGALALYKKFEPYKDSKESAATLLDKLYTSIGGQLRTTRQAQAIRALKAILRTKEVLSHNGNYQLAIEMMLLQTSGHFSA
jgi:DNA polymerase III gamma/tau subunit